MVVPLRPERPGGAPTQGPPPVRRGRPDPDGPPRIPRVGDDDAIYHSRTACYAGRTRGADFRRSRNTVRDRGRGLDSPTPPAPGISPPQQDKEGTGYFGCAKCGKRKKWSPKGNAAGKAPWPGAECWDCYRGVKGWDCVRGATG